ncbi:MAG TPA: hypothetical protein VGF48_00425 [Thermoanaerobaculia bacterium]|jgi:hypothetical protein
MKKSTIGIIVVAALVVVAGLVAAAFFAGRAFFKEVKPKPVTEADRKVVVTAERLHEHGGPEPNPDYEKITVQRFFGSATIQYEYDIPAHVEADDKVYIQSSVNVTMSSAEAIQQHTLGVLTLRAGMAAVDGVQVVAAPHLLTFGDQKYSALLKRGDDPVGNLLVVRDGRIVHMLIVSGIYFEDAKAITELMKPPVDEARKQFSRKR